MTAQMKLSIDQCESAAEAGPSNKKILFDRINGQTLQFKAVRLFTSCY